jgi:hypothetical protein
VSYGENRYVPDVEIQSLRAWNVLDRNNPSTKVRQYDRCCRRQARKDGIDSEGLRVLEWRWSRIACGTGRRSTVVHNMIERSKVGTS